uniref:Os08g0170800 protein n=1 Tax=Mesocestoides corti TaxID=53468 RepID=A0A5K3ELS4_MESCO
AVRVVDNYPIISPRAYTTGEPIRRATTTTTSSCLRHTATTHPPPPPSSSAPSSATRCGPDHRRRHPAALVSPRQTGPRGLVSAGLVI